MVRFLWMLTVPAIKDTGGKFWFWLPENFTISLGPFDLVRLLMIILNVMIT